MGKFILIRVCIDETLRDLKVQIASYDGYRCDETNVVESTKGSERSNNFFFFLITNIL